MPPVIVPQLSRRAVGLSLFSLGVSVAHAAPQSARLALLSDIHVPTDTENEYRGFRPYDNLKKVVAEVAQARPEAALITGDLARQRGQASDYETLRKLLVPLGADLPVLMALGNHDSRNNFLAVFGPQPGAQPLKGKHVSAWGAGKPESTGPAVRLILLDSLMETETIPGFLGRAQRAWLREYLGAHPPVPTLLFVHHNLDDDDGGLLDAPRLIEIVKQFSQVKAIVYGHTHVYRFSEWEGCHLVNVPATAFNFMDRQPVGWLEAELTPEAGRFTLHAIGGDKGMDGKTQALKWR